MRKRVALRVMAFLVACVTLAATAFVYRLILLAIGGDPDHWYETPGRYRVAALFLTIPWLVGGLWPAVWEINKSINLSVYGNERGPQLPVDREPPGTPAPPPVQNRKS